MKKIFLLIAAVSFAGSVMAGGLVTNTNHSAAYTRMQCRDATLGVDAAYFNPAGITKLSKGLHFSLSNQTVKQTWDIESNYPLLNGTPKNYEGIVSAPIFPAFYAVFNTGKVAFSFGFNPIGGGGGASFEDGIPSIEYDASSFVPALSANGVTGYEIDANFEATSIYFGYQVNVAYAINDMISVALGGRYVTAKNTYDGYLTNVNLNYNGTMTPVAGVFNDLSSQATAGATMATGAAASVQPIIDGGGGGFTLPQLVGAGMITEADRLTLEGGLNTLGIDPTGYTTTQVQSAYTGAATSLTATATELGGQAIVYGNLMDQTAKVEQTATGFTPIISVNFSPIEMLNISIKYEGKTNLEFENNTTSDFITAVDPVTGALTESMFPDGYVYNADIPAQLVVGAMLKPIDKIMVTGGIQYFFDKSVDYSKGEGIEMIDNNFIVYAIGAEYAISNMIKFSLGYSGTKTGVNSDYNSDTRFSLNTNSFGGGLGIHITPMIEINLGGAITNYEEGSKDLTKTLPGPVEIPYKEFYDKSIMLFAVGVDLHF
ncbi:MAG: hypothetical protein K8R35_10835 [Bacteroidales bacterium]|nr:hypothetical protein [Bacteroidales bacterium]